MPDAASPPTDAFATFRVPAYRAYSAYRLFNSGAIQAQSLAVSWQIYQLTHDPLMLGLIGLAEAVPALGVALLAGHVADVMSRRTILLFCSCLLTLSTLGLAVISLGRFHDVLTAHYWIIYAIVFLTGLCRGFLSPAQFGLLGQIVPPGLYGNASIWNANVWQAAAIGGPALAGIIYAFCGPTITYGLAAAAMAVGWVCLLRIQAPPTRAPRTDQSIYESIREGLRFVFRNQVILGAMSLDLFAVLFGGAVAILPIFADILQAGPSGLGLLRSAPGIGSVIVGVYLSYRPVKRRAGAALIWNVVGFGVSMILFAVSRSFWLSFILLLISGGFDAVSVFVRWTMFQIVTPDHMKGRVAAVSSIFVGSSNEIGEFESGVMARLLGTVRSVVFGGCMTLFVVGTTAWAAPKLRALDLSKVKHEE